MMRTPGRKCSQRTSRIALEGTPKAIRRSCANRTMDIPANCMTLPQCCLLLAKTPRERQVIAKWEPRHLISCCDGRNSHMLAAGTEAQVTAAVSGTVEDSSGSAVRRRRYYGNKS